MQIPAHFPTEPRLVWSYFHAINQIPRPSKKEDKLRAFILERAEKFKLKTHVDQVGNVIVYVPASMGKENNQTVIIQNHMDMVTDATADREINFDRDPIITFREGDWIKADRTTLGADNGIGCAAALAVMEDTTIEHPPLELLFTIDEETGLKGAWGVDSSKLQGKKMINLDTEEWGSLYIGCAGGIDYEFTRSVKMVPAKIKGTPLKLTVGGRGFFYLLFSRSDFFYWLFRGSFLRCYLLRSSFFSRDLLRSSFLSRDLLRSSFFSRDLFGSSFLSSLFGYLISSFFYYFFGCCFLCNSFFSLSGCFFCNFFGLFLGHKRSF
jgi:hypothetical protein